MARPGLTGMSSNRKIYYDLGEWPRQYEEEKEKNERRASEEDGPHHSTTDTLRKNVNTEYIYCLCSIRPCIFFVSFGRHKAKKYHENGQLFSQLKSFS